jgi:hypothetical protein
MQAGDHACLGMYAGAWLIFEVEQSEQVPAGEI